MTYNREYVKTSDKPFAGYLMLKGYTAISCVDEGIYDQRGNPRFSFYLTHSDPEIRKEITNHMSEMRELFETTEEQFQLFHKRMKHLHKLAQNPVKLSDFEKGE